MQHNEQLAERLAMIANELSHIAKMLENPQMKPSVPESAKAKASAGLCLHTDCDRTSETHQLRRGNCPTHYNQLMRIIAVRGAVAEFGFIESGLLLPVDFNPSPTEVDKVVESLDNQEARLLAAAKKKGEQTARKKLGRSKSS